MKAFVACAVVAFCAGIFAAPAPVPAKKAAPKAVPKAAPKAAPKKGTPVAAQKKGAPAATAYRAPQRPQPRWQAPKKTYANRYYKRPYVPPRPVGQQIPTPERYKEIQQALIDRGFLSSEANGQWGPDSVDALKRFQSEQKIDATGKLDAKSLISLGLGPKRMASAQTTTSQ